MCLEWGDMCIHRLMLQCEHYTNPTKTKKGVDLVQSGGFECLIREVDFSGSSLIRKDYYTGNICEINIKDIK
jgi:hypothetical protein